MIIRFKHQLAEDIFLNRITGASRKFPLELRKIVDRKLQYLNAALKLQDLKSPPGNRLEMLQGNLKGYYSIRINSQWRIIFKWKDGADEVQIIDYHKG